MNPLCASGEHVILPLELICEPDDAERMRYCRAVLAKGLETAHEEYVARLQARAATMKGH